MYWLLEVRAPEGQTIAMIGSQPEGVSAIDGEPVSWYSGVRFKRGFDRALEFALDTKGGSFIPDFFKPPIPLMSARMLKVLQAEGVDNIDSYDAVIRGLPPGAGEYRAVNIVGRVACADLESSICVVDDPEDPVGTEFDSLVIDEGRAGGALLFRLHEAAHAVVVRDPVKRGLERAGLSGLVFVEPKDWSS